MVVYRGVFAATVLLLATSSTWAQVADPSFELGGGAWTTYGGGGLAPPDNAFGITPDDGSVMWAAARSFSAANPPGNTDGLYQSVTTTAGVDYTLTVAGQAHNRFRQSLPGPERFVYIAGDPADTPDTTVRIGVDPTGGLNPAAATVHWRAPETTGAQWTDLELYFTATGASSTLFLESNQTFALDGHWSGFDNVRLAESAPAVPEPASVAIWSFVGIGLAGFTLRQVRSRK